uniref:Hypothetical secreted protein n=1 Tax=Glossina morsitans morsitans TaxID=37546 RepID=D3TMB7_GLOMM
MRIIVLLALGLLTFSFICYAHADNIPVQREFPADPADLESDDLEEDLEALYGDVETTVTATTGHQPRTFGLLFLLSALLSQLRNQQQNQQQNQPQNEAEG